MTGNDVIEEVNRLLLSSSREELNKLSGSVAPNATSLTFTYDLGGIRAGSEVNIDLETYRVWTTDPGTKTATVQPAMSGTDSVAHSAGSIAYVNPRFSKAAIFSALNQELRALSGNVVGLYRMKTLEWDLTGLVTDYDLASDVEEVYEVRIRSIGPGNSWERLDWKWIPDADKTFFPSGNGIHIMNGFPGRQLQVLYKTGFDLLTDPAQDLFTVAGVEEELQDIVVYGILLRLGPVREIKRSFTEAQGDSRRAEEIQAGAIQNSFASVRAMYRDRIQTERARLMQRYPMYHRDFR